MSSPSHGQGPAHGSSLGDAKYAKLATEYSKCRAQLSVVKKAFFEEQAKSAETSEQLREKELSLRKTGAEMDSLQFRNQQLTQRIRVLQDEMDALSHQGGHGGKHKRPAPSSNAVTSSSAEAQMFQASENLNSVIGQELQCKIEENARLHARLADVDHKYEELVGGLQNRVRELESELKKKAQSERAEDSKQKDLIVGLKADNVQLLGKIKELERELVDQADRVTVLQVQLESAGEMDLTLPASASASRKRSAANQPDVGMSNSSSGGGGSSSFPLTLHDARVQSVEILSQFSEHVSELVAALSDFHTYWEHRLKDTQVDDAPLSDDASSLSKLLLQNVRHLKPIEESFQSVLSRVLSSAETDATPIVSYFGPLSASFRGYVEYARQMEPLKSACLEHESGRQSCPPTQRAKNKALQRALAEFNRELGKVAELLAELADEKAVSDAEAASSLLQSLTATFPSLCHAAKDLYDLYAAKSQDENQLPTVTDQLKNTNQCVVSALSNLYASVNGLAVQLDDNLARMASLVRLGQDLAASAGAEGGGAAAVGQRKEEEEAEEDKEEDENVKREREEDTRRKEEELKHLLDAKDQLAQTVSELGEKIRELEKNREHWKLEYQLLQMKHEKARAAEPETDQDKLFAEREEELKKPFRDRINSLMSERLLSDSKASTFYLECSSLQRRHSAAERRRAEAELRLKKAHQQIIVLQEELNTTAGNYESQLGMMTEHVANMNDKLTEQTDEINRLKYEGKGGKKGKK